jgi:putative intracellular protease/amidase
MTILMVTTSASALDAEHPTGLWLEEFAVPYNLLRAANFDITVASPQGGRVPLDPKTNPDAQQKLDWAAALAALEHTLPLAQVQASDYVAVFLPGGHGPMIDLVHDVHLNRLLREFDQALKPIAAVCHGPAALLNVTGFDGRPLLAGRKATGFTNLEEKMALLADVVPFLLQDEMQARGADYQSALLPYVSHVVQDGHLLTGQNPASSEALARLLIRVLQPA